MTSTIRTLPFVQHQQQVLLQQVLLLVLVVLLLVVVPLSSEAFVLPSSSQINQLLQHQQQQQHGTVHLRYERQQTKINAPPPMIGGTIKSTRSIPLFQSSRSTSFVPSSRSSRSTRGVTTSTISTTVTQQQQKQQQQGGNLIFRPPSFMASSAAAAASITTTTVAPRTSGGSVQQQQQQSKTATTAGTAGAGTASIPTLTISLVKQIVGGCLLALPAGVASLSTTTTSSTTSIGVTTFDESILPWAIGSIIMVGYMNSFFFNLVGKVCYWTNSTTFQQAWERSVGSSGSSSGTQEQQQQLDGSSSTESSSPSQQKWVSYIITLKTTLSCIAYAMILGDSTANIWNQFSNDIMMFLRTFTHSLTSSGHNHNDMDLDLLLSTSSTHLVTRTESLLFITMFVLIPLCCLPNLSSLTPFTLLGLGMILFTAGTIVVRYLDGSYQMGGTYYSTSSMAPTNVINPEPFIATTTGTTSSISTSTIPPALQPYLESTTMDPTTNMMMMTTTTVTDTVTAVTALPIDGTNAVATVANLADAVVIQNNQNGIVDSIVTIATTTLGTSTTDFNHLFHPILDTISTTVSSIMGSSSSSSVNLVEFQSLAVFVCTLITSFVAHYNAPRYHSELQNPNTERFHTVTNVSYGFATFIFILVAISGYLTFGSNTLPFVLNNYFNTNDVSNTGADPLITISNILLIISICLTFPLPFVGLRDNIKEIIKNNSNNNDNNNISNKANQRKEPWNVKNLIPTSTTTRATTGMEKENHTTILQSFTTVRNSIEKDWITALQTMLLQNNDVLTIVLLGFIVLVASNVHDLNSLLSIGGGTFSLAVSTILPTIMYRAAVLQQKKRLEQEQENQKDNVHFDNVGTTKGLTIQQDTTLTPTTGIGGGGTDVGNMVWNEMESYLAMFFMSICVVMGGTGVTVAVSNLL